MSGESHEQRTRRRWITLAEAVAVAGVLIAGLTLYLSWQEKRDERADRVAAVQAERRTATVVTLRATPAKDGERLDLADPQHPVDAIDVAFPSALGIPAQTALVRPRIDRDWFDDELLDRTKDEKAGRLPVLVTVTHWDGEARRSDRAIYDIVWRTDGGLFGRSLKLDGLLLRERGGTAARLDSLWRAAQPTSSSSPKK